MNPVPQDALRAAHDDATLIGAILTGTEIATPLWQLAALYIARRMSAEHCVDTLRGIVSAIRVDEETLIDGPYRVREVLRDLPTLVHSAQRHVRTIERRLARREGRSA